MRIVAIVALLAGLGAGFVSLAVPTPASADTPLRVAMLPVIVNANTADTDYLSVGIADMLAARLEQSGEVAIIRLEDGSTDPEAARKAAAGVGAKFVVFGSYTQFGDGASLDLRCAPADGDGDDGPRRVFVQAGSPAEIIPKLDELAQRVTQYLVGASVSAPPPAARTAAAPVAAPAESASQTISDLQRRVAELERVIFNRSPDDQ